MIAAIALQLSTGNKYHSLIFCLSFSNYEIFGKKKKKENRNHCTKCIAESK